MRGSLRQFRRLSLALTAILALGAALTIPLATPAQAQWWSGIWVGPWPWLTYGVPATGLPQALTPGASPLSDMAQSGGPAACPMAAPSMGGLSSMGDLASPSGMPAMGGMSPMGDMSDMMVVCHARMPMMGMGMPMGPMHMRGMRGPARGELRTTVLIYDGFFLPSDITIPVGTTVTWINRSRSPKSVTSPGIWDSGTIPPNGRYSAVFAVEGTFSYMGATDDMQGRITVTAAPPGAREPHGAPGAHRGMEMRGAPGGAPAAAAQPAGTVTATATLQPQRDSGVTGEATLTQSGNTTTVTVRLHAPSGGTAHAGHIHGGSCSGPILFPLETIQLDASGNGSATSTVNAPIDAGNWWIQYHQSASPPGPGVACGQVVASQ
ncbi:MAG TPA: CHRD domain-containing protein [Chloroflexota bacterium]|nr:CHRD domain-containing protein [Chloroflexota bacterium]